VSDEQALKMAKILTVFWGIVVTLLAWLMIDIKSILVTIQSIAGILVGPVLGIFVLGMFTRRSNWQGALSGMLSALIPLIIIKYGATILASVYGLLGLDMPIPVWLFYLSTITFTVYGFIGLILSTSVGYITSLLFRPTEKNIDVVLWKARGWKEMLLGNPDGMIDISHLLEKTESNHSSENSRDNDE
jgi:Na+(H+)/acetate symporter ActP